MISTVFKRLKPQSEKNKERGNAMIYVLLAIALFGILTATLSGQNSDVDGQDIDDELVEFYANEILEYSAAAKNVIDQMLITGSSIDDLDFVNPSSAGFDTPPHTHKVFHPEGGGLTYAEKYGTYNLYVNKTSGVPDEGTFLGRFNNVEWTPTIENDVILTFYVIKSSVCEKLNEKITGSKAIPTMTTDLRVPLIDASLHSGTNIDLDTTSCPGCDGYISLCAENSVQTAYSFYTILAAR